MTFVILSVLISLITVWIVCGHEVDKKRWCLIFGHRPGPDGDCVRCKTYSELSFEEPLRYKDPPQILLLTKTVIY